MTSPCFRFSQGGGTEAAAISAAALALQLPAEGISLIASSLAEILPRASESGSGVVDPLAPLRGTSGERVAAVAAVGALLGGHADRGTPEAAVLTAALSAAALEDPSPSVRRHAVGALQAVFGQAVPEEVVAVLRSAAADADDDVASSAIGALRDAVLRESKRGTWLGWQARGWTTHRARDPPALPSAMYVCGRAFSCFLIPTME